MLARTGASRRRYGRDSPLLDSHPDLTERFGGANDIVRRDQNVDISHDASGCRREALGIVCAALEQQAWNAGPVECIQGGHDFRQGKLGLRPVRLGHALQSRKQFGTGFELADPARKRCKQPDFPPLGVLEHAGAPPCLPGLARLAFLGQVRAQEKIDVRRRPSVLDHKALDHVPLRFLSSAALTAWRYP